MSEEKKTGVTVTVPNWDNINETVIHHEHGHAVEVEAGHLYVRGTNGRGRNAITAIYAPARWTRAQIG